MRKEQLKHAIGRRKQLLKEAAAAGLPTPAFKRGRPRIYETEEEARKGQRAMNKACIARQNERLRQASAALLVLVESGKLVRSTDEPQNL